MRQLNRFVAAVATALAVASPALAEEPTRVSGVVETPHAVFFQPSQFPNVVWFFPRITTSFTIVPPELPAGTFWRAALVFELVTREDLALLPPAWQTLSFVPFIIRPASECVLTRLPEMRFITQEVHALGRDVSSANPPVCRFSLRLPTVMSDDLRARLDALLGSDTLIQRALPIDLLVDATIPWSEVHSAVAAAISDQSPAPDPDPGLKLGEVAAVIESALASPALSDIAAATPAEREVFVQAVIATLFSSTIVDDKPLFRLVPVAPTGSITYHQESFHRDM